SSGNRHLHEGKMRPHRVAHCPDIVMGHEFADHVADLGEGTRLLANVTPRGCQEPIEIKVTAPLFSDRGPGPGQHRLEGGAKPYIIFRREDMERSAHQCSLD